jgi:hypothetical protein
MDRDNGSADGEHPQVLPCLRQASSEYNNGYRCVARDVAARGFGFDDCVTGGGVRNWFEPGSACAEIRVR